MRAICVDDERILAEDVAEMCLELPEIHEVKVFCRARPALQWLGDHPVDLALLDIDMPDMNGIELAANIKNRWPEVAVIFLTGYSEYAVEAFAVRARGYLLKPVTKEALAADVAYALSGRITRLTGHVVVKTFGNFDIFVDGKPVSFKMEKCKEILAYLVNKLGTGVKRAEIAAILWEDRLYDRKQQKLLDVYIRSLRDTLQEYGAEHIMELKRGVLRIFPETFVCDAYLFFSGDESIINSYHGEYMNSYTWASITESMMYWKVINQKSQ